MFSEALSDRLRGSTVLMSAPCIGNLGAMTVDCLLATLSTAGKLHREGSGDSRYLIPLTGHESFPGDEDSFITMPVEVYSVSDKDSLFIIQVRSSCDIQRISDFMVELLSSMNAAAVSHLVLLSGFGEDDVLDENQAFCIGGFYAGSNSLGREALANCPYPRLVEYILSGEPIFGVIGDLLTDPEDDLDGLQIAISNPALLALRETGKDALSVPVSVLGLCCRIGNHIGASKELAAKVGHALEILPSDRPDSILAPLSWKIVFGI